MTAPVAPAPTNDQVIAALQALKTQAASTTATLLPLAQTLKTKQATIATLQKKLAGLKG